MDVYVLAAGRSADTVRRFADAWLGGFVFSAAEVEVPQYADEPETVYESADAAIEWLLARPREPHALYWRDPRRGDVRHAMLFFTEDEGLVAGLTVRDGDAPGERLRRLADSVDGRLGYVTWETPPPDTVEEFRRVAAAADPPRLVDGRLEL